MGVDRCVGHHDAFGDFDTIGCEIPDGFETCSSHGVGSILGLVGRHGEDTDGGVESALVVLKVVDVIDGHIADGGADDVGVGVETGYDVQTIVGKPGVVDECCAKAAYTDDEGVVHFFETEKLLQSVAQGIDFVADARFALDVEKRQVFGYLRRVDAECFGYLCR